MARKSTIGTNPLDAVVPARTAKPAAKRRKPQPAAPAKTKERATILLSVEVLERARNACYWTPALTMAALVEAALDAELARLERKRGEPFPARDGKIRTGRPQGR